MKKIAILTDSSANISELEAKNNEIYVVRMPIIINDKEYIEGETITYKEFIGEMENKAICKTSQPSVGKTLEIFDALLKDYEHIIFIPISSGLSGTYSTSMTLVKEYDNKVTVLDAKHVTYPLAILCMQVRGLINEGKTIEQIKDIVENKSEFWGVLLPDNLEYLKRGGRISSSAALLGNLLKIVPILKVENGLIDVYDKVRTKSKAIKVAIDAVTNVPNHDDYIWLVIHADYNQQAELIQKEMLETIKQPVLINTIGSIVMSHTGPKTLGIARIKKINNVY